MKYMPIFIKEADELEKKNERLIAEFEALPFWKKWGKREALKNQIIDSWKSLTLNN